MLCYVMYVCVYPSQTFVVYDVVFNLSLARRFPCDSWRRPSPSTVPEELLMVGGQGSIHGPWVGFPRATSLMRSGAAPIRAIFLCSDICSSFIWGHWNYMNSHDVTTEFISWNYTPVIPDGPLWVCWSSADLKVVEAPEGHWNTPLPTQPLAARRIYGGHEFRTGQRLHSHGSTMFKR